MTRIVVWLAGHPMMAVFLALVLLGGTSWGIAYAFSAREPRPERPVMAESGVAPSVLPKPTQFAPRARVNQAHRAFHAMGRACQQPVAAREPYAVRRPVAIMEQFARDFPRAGFTIDVEPGSTLALLIVLRSELQQCEPSLLPSVEVLIPREYRDPSTP